MVSGTNFNNFIARNKHWKWLFTAHKALCSFTVLQSFQFFIMFVRKLPICSTIKNQRFRGKRTRDGQHIRRTRYIFWVNLSEFGIIVKLIFSNLYSRKNSSVRSFCWTVDPEEYVYLHEITDITKIICRAIYKILTKKEKTLMKS